MIFWSFIAVIFNHNNNVILIFNHNHIFSGGNEVWQPEKGGGGILGGVQVGPKGGGVLLRRRVYLNWSKSMSGYGIMCP